MRLNLVNIVYQICFLFHLNYMQPLWDERITHFDNKKNYIKIANLLISGKFNQKKILFRYNKFRFSGQCPVTGQRPVDIFSVELYINLIFIYFG